MGAVLRKALAKRARVMLETIVWYSLLVAMLAKLEAVWVRAESIAELHHNEATVVPEVMRSTPVKRVTHCLLMVEDREEK